MCPATYHDAIIKVYNAVANGHISLYVMGEYERTYKGRKVSCPIGYLIGASRRKQIAEMKLDNFQKCIDSRGVVWETFGDRTMLALLGMTRKQAVKLQQTFDDLSYAIEGKQKTYEEARAEFVAWLREQMLGNNAPNPALNN
jgi:hypothetical protein